MSQKKPWPIIPNDRATAINTALNELGDKFAYLMNPAYRSQPTKVLRDYANTLSDPLEREYAHRWITEQ